MRRPTALALLPALSLAACTAPGGNNQAAPPAPAGNTSVNASAPAAGDEAAKLAQFRARWLAACIGGGNSAAPPHTPVGRHCSCAIDRMMAGKSLDQLEEEQTSGAYRDPFRAEMRRCIREIRS